MMNVALGVLVGLAIGVIAGVLFNMPIKNELKQMRADIATHTKATLEAIAKKV
jgi:small basic protein